MIPSFSPVQQKRILLVCGIILAVLVGFKIGETVGYRKASFSYRWEDGYTRMFGPRGRGGLPPEFGHDPFTDPHGVEGTIVQISLPSLIVSGKDGVEKTVTIDSETLIRKLSDSIASSSLATGDTVIVLGEPTDTARIEARLIRVLPKSGAAHATSTANTTH